MTTMFAPPELLYALSCGILEEGGDEPLRKGTHLRVVAGLGGSFPMTPFVVFPVTPQERDDVTTTWNGPVLTCSFVDDDNDRTVAIVFTPTDGSLRVQLLDDAGHVVATRDEFPWLIDPGAYRRFLVTGTTQGLTVHRQVVNVDLLLGVGEPSAVIGLPVVQNQGTPFERHSWYLAADDHDTALRRVRDGAPLRLNPMDRPDGPPFDDVDEDQEVARVQALLGAAARTGGLEIGRLLAAVVDGDDAPWTQIEQLDLAGSPNSAQVPRLAALQMAALDPGVARYLGFASFLERTFWDDPRPLAVVSMLAIDAAAVGAEFPHLVPWLAAGPAPGEQSLRHQLIKGLESDLGPELDKLTQRAQDDGLVVRTVAAVTQPLPPWSAPTLPQPGLVDHRWEVSDGVAASGTYRVTFRFPDPPPAILAALSRGVDGTPFVSRLEPAGSSLFPDGPRRYPSAFGQESDPTAEVRAVLPNGNNATLTPGTIITDQGIPADQGPLSYRFHAADVFGRFGGPTTVRVAPPSRPAPPVPVLRHHLRLPDDLAGLPPTGPLSPGTVVLEIVVPGLDELAAGSLPIAAVTVNGAEHAATPGTLTVELTLDPLLPGQRLTLPLSVAFRDAAGTLSAAASTTVTVHDRRLPAPLRTGPGIVWTSTPGPAPDVELVLTWHTAANATHRVYLVDQHALGVEPPQGASRAWIADRGIRTPPVPRDRYRLLSELVDADGDGRAVLRVLLPRSLRTVQFLRIVPLSEQGAEAPFDACGLIPVAVPDTRAPAAPRVDSRVDPASGRAELTVIADGLDAVALGRDQPGLFTPGAGSAVPPRFRIRRAVAHPPSDAARQVIPHPAYARPTRGGDGPLALTAAGSPDAPPVFTGSPLPDDQDTLEPFVRYVYWAEVRMPPERRLLAPVESTSQISALDPADEQDHERPSSQPSPPLTLLHQPPDPPAAPDLTRVHVTVTAFDEIQLILVDPPRAHPAAIGPYRLAAWYRRARRGLTAVSVVDGQPSNGVWPVAGSDPITLSVPPAGPLLPPTALEGGAGVDFSATVFLAWMDPAGRLGALSAPLDLLVIPITS